MTTDAPQDEDARFREEAYQGYLRSHEAHRHALERVLNWVNAQEGRMIRKGDLYDAVMEMDRAPSPPPLPFGDTSAADTDRDGRDPANTKENQECQTA